MSVLGPEKPQWECVVDGKAALGEIPIWDDSKSALYWLDLFSPSFHRTTLGAESLSVTWPLPAAAGSYALVEGRDDMVLMALSTGIFLMDLSTGRLRQVLNAPYDQTHFRFNDGRCDSKGRFWIGTARLPQSDKPDGTGSYWCLDGSNLTRKFGGVTIANGTAFSPDDSVMYIADRPNWQLLAFDFDVDAAEVTNRRRFAPVSEGQIPDGAAVDVKGGYWIAMFGAGRILRFLPDGTLDRELLAPVSHPTMVAFGGSELSDLYVTSSRQFAAAVVSEEPQAGGVFRTSLDVAGLREPRFRLPESWMGI